VVEPLTDYLRYELGWSYPPNVKAGEDIRILPAEAGHRVQGRALNPDGNWRSWKVRRARSHWWRSATSPPRGGLCRRACA